MTKDIVAIRDNDLVLFETEAPRAANILSVQEGALEYTPLFGIDLRYFLSESFRFQNDSFKAYVIERLSSRGINVASVVEVVDNLMTTLNISVGDDNNSSGMIAR